MIGSSFCSKIVETFMGVGGGKRQKISTCMVGLSFFSIVSAKKMQNRHPFDVSFFPQKKLVCRVLL